MTDAMDTIAAISLLMVIGSSIAIAIGASQYDTTPPVRAFALLTGALTILGCLVMRR